MALAALGIAAAGILVTVWAMATNAFFHGVERAGKDGHTLCTGGPYQFLRHPSALGVLVFNLSRPLVLGSIWALIPAMLVVGEVVLNTTREERTLQRELHGYKQYSQIVRYRFSKETIAALQELKWWEASLEDLESVSDEFWRPLEGGRVR